MALDELKENLSDIDRDMRSYLENTEKYYKLHVFKILMRSISGIVKLLLIGSIALLALFILSFGMAYGMGLWLENTFLGFVSVGIFYMLIGWLLYLFRDRLDRPILKKFSEYYFDD